MGIRKGGIIPLGVRCLRGFEEGNYLLKSIPRSGGLTSLRFILPIIHL